MRSIGTSTQIKNLMQLMLSHGEHSEIADSPASENGGESKADTEHTSLNRELKNLLKKLRKQKCLDDLKKAIIAEGTYLKCVVYKIPEKEQTTYGGQMKTFPHFICCKICRFPDLLTHHQLRPVAQCLRPFNKAQKMVDICVNPYHYEIIEKPRNPKIVVRRHMATEEGQNVSDMQEKADKAKKGIDESGIIPNITLSDFEIDTSNNKEIKKLENGCGGPSCSSSSTANDSGYGPAQMPSMTASMEADDEDAELMMDTGDNFWGQKIVQQHQQNVPSGDQSNAPLHQNAGSPQGYLSDDFDQQLSPCSDVDGQTSPLFVQQHQFMFNPNRQSTSNDPLINGCADHQKQMTYDSTRFVSAVNGLMEEQQFQQNSQQQQEQQQHQNVSRDLPSLSLPNGISVVQYEEPMFWCTVTYYELNQRVGEVFHASKPSLIIDGYTSPTSEDRFCLGQMPNIKRTNAVQETRKFIGKGARIYNIGGDVYCETLSDAPVFIQAPNVAARNGWHASTVCKVPQYCNLKVFSMSEFGKLLNTAVKQGYEAVYSLTRLCTIRISFVKGWGIDYRRQNVTSTPCWLEIHLTGPLDWIDSVLLQIGAPPIKCTSYS